MTDLDKIIDLRKQLSETSTEDSVTRGVLIFDTSKSKILEDTENTEIEITVNGRAIAISQLRGGEKLDITFPGCVGFFYEKFSLFLKHFPDKEPTQRYYIHDLSFDSEQPNQEHIQILRYREALKLWKLLTGLADHVDGRRLFLLSSDKLDLECKYQVSDLRQIPHLNELVADFSVGAASREEKRTLFKRALLEALNKIAGKDRFGYLLANFEAIHDRYWQNFRLFLEGISYESIFEGYVEKHSKLVTDLNSILGGIQTAIIGLPIASFVLLEKMRIANEPEFKNALLLLGCGVFVAFLLILSFSQGSTLKSTSELARELDSEVKKKHPELALKLGNSMRRLRSHQRRILLLLWLIRGLLTLLVVASIGTYLFVSYPEVRDWLNELLRSLTPTHTNQSAA